MGHIRNKSSQLYHLYDIIFCGVLFHKTRVLQISSAGLCAEILLHYCRKHCCLPHLRENHYYMVLCNLHKFPSCAEYFKA